MLLPKRSSFLDISPWLYSIITFLIAIATIGFVSLPTENSPSTSRNSSILGGLVIDTERGLEIWDRSIHGPYNPALRSARVGDLIGEYPEYEASHARGSLHLGTRITMLIEINGAPADIETVMALLPQIEKHNDIKVGAFLHQNRSNGIVYFSHPDYPWRFAWSGLAWDALAALPSLAFLWLVGWQVTVAREGRRRKRLSDGTCPRCRYDIRTLSEPRCPECGETW